MAERTPGVGPGQDIRRARSNTLVPVLFGALTLTKLAESMGVTESGFQGFVGIALVSLSLLLAAVVLGLPVVYRVWASQRKWVAYYERGGIFIALALVGVVALGWLLPLAYHSLLDVVGSPGIVLALFASLPFLFAGIAFALGSSSMPGRLLIVLAGVSGPLLLLIGYMVLNDWIDASLWNIGWLLATSAALIAWLWFINVNQISPHRYYRNRLAETYLLRRGEAAAVDPQPLSEMRSGNPTVPYHLINAAVNLPASKASGLRGRSPDFFLFSRHYCGSPMLGYCQTEALEKKDPNLDLGTAMAVSGAAASSYMGTTTVKGLAFWLSLLNIRWPTGCPTRSD